MNIDYMYYDSPRFFPIKDIMTPSKWKIELLISRSNFTIVF